MVRQDVGGISLWHEVDSTTSFSRNCLTSHINGRLAQCKMTELLLVGNLLGFLCELTFNFVCLGFLEGVKLLQFANITHPPFNKLCWAWFRRLLHNNHSRSWWRPAAAVVALVVAVYHEGVCKDGRGRLLLQRCSGGWWMVLPCRCCTFVQVVANALAADDE